MSNSFDIVTIGSATVDYFVDFASELIGIETPSSREELLAIPLGGKILIDELNITTGGGGTNTAVAFSHLGLNTAYAGKLGSDPGARLVLDRLAQDKITFLGSCEGQTGLSIILNSIRDDRSILAYKGTNNTLVKEDLQDFETDWIYLSSMLGQSFDTACQLVAASQAKVAFNPSSYQSRLGYGKLKAVIDRVSVLIMNREEACELLGYDPSHDYDTVKLIRDMDFVAGQIVVITDASRGAWVRQGEQLLHGKVTADLKIAETTGAGDAFGATFTAAIMRELPLRTALDFAMTNAESVIQYKGAKEKLLSWQALEDQVAAGRRSITEIISGTSPT